MLFSLKNAGATYQWLVNKVFADKIGRTMKAYVDDVLTKSSIVEQHMQDLTNTFSTFRLYNIKLNLEKCTFKVEVWKFLGFMISQKGIEAKPKKIQVVLDIQQPWLIKDIQKLAERIAALYRFVSKLVDKCLSSFKIL